MDDGNGVFSQRNVCKCLLKLENQNLHLSVNAAPLYTTIFFKPVRF